MDEKKCVLSVRDLEKGFDGDHVLRGIDLDVYQGDVISVIGPSGSGKSTLIRCIDFLEEPDKGSVILDGTDYTNMSAPLKELHEKVGMVFQSFNLWPHLTVQQNLIEAPCRVLGLSKDQALARAEKLLERLRLKPYSDRYPLHLSGGQQQRVAIARALMMEPQVLLFDEPTAALDPEITAQIVSIIRELAETNITQVIVTHEVEVARKTASRVVYMENGHIVEQGDASCFTEPQTEAFKNYLSH